MCSKISNFGLSHNQLVQLHPLSHHDNSLWSWSFIILYPKSSRFIVGFTLWAKIAKNCLIIFLYKINVGWSLQAKAKSSCCIKPSFSLDGFYVLEAFQNLDYMFCKSKQNKTQHIIHSRFEGTYPFWNFQTAWNNP